MAEADADIEGLEDVSDDNPYTREPDTDFAPICELSKDEAEHQVEYLREAVRFHDYRYYVLNDPVISDPAYDDLFARLEALEHAFDLVSENSPTQRVGGEPLDELGTLEHVAPMLSIDSSGEEVDVRNFDDRISRELREPYEYVCEPKFDGLSVEVVYIDGEYERAATRGDGETGEDVTENVRTIRSIPMTLRGDHPNVIAIRGEIYIPKDAFQAYNKERVEQGEDPFANPRNAAAGTLRQLDPSVTDQRPLDCFFYEVLGAGESEEALEKTDASRGAMAAEELETHWSEHEAFPGWGLTVNERCRLVDDIDGAIEYRNELMDRREDLNYEIDGVVIKVNDRRQCEQLGTTARHYRWSYAYKFPARSEETNIADITVQVGRTGRLTPVALLDPVDVGGVTVSRASLHNQEEIAAMGVNVGDRVKIERAGDVIPYVDAVVESHSRNHFRLPDECPQCGSPVEMEGPLTFCTGGLSCPAQLKRAVEYWASDDGLDIEGLGEKAADEFVEKRLVEDDVADLYDLTLGDLTRLDGWGQKSAQNLLDELEGSMHPTLADFLAALGIPEVGPTVARDLAMTFGDTDSLMAASEADLRRVDGIGPKVALRIADFFENEQNQRVIERLRDRGVEPQTAEALEGGDELDGLTFVFTGSVENWTRDELQVLVERHGGSATTSVSGNSDYLVIGENPGQSKRDAAQEHDVDQIDPDEFFELVTAQGVDVDR